MRTDETNPEDWLLLADERLRAADALHASIGATCSGIERTGADHPALTLPQILDQIAAHADENPEWLNKVAN